MMVVAGPQRCGSSGGKVTEVVCVRTSMNTSGPKTHNKTDELSFIQR